MTIVLDGTNGITAPGVESFGNGTPLGGTTNPIVAMTGAASNYVQAYVVNNTNGTSSSADLVAYPSNGTDSHGWVDMGITSLSYADTTYTVTGPNEAYLFGSAPSGSSTTGNLVIATDNTGTSNSIQFYTNGFTQAKSAAKMVIDGATGNVGIGTSSPSTYSAKTAIVAPSSSYALALSAASTGGTYYWQNFFNGTTQIGYFGSDGTSFGFNTSTSSAYYTWGINGTEKMRMDTSGNLLVGTTTAISGTRMAVERTPGAANECNISFTASGTQKWKIGNNATDSFIVYNASNAGVYLNQGSTSWISTSDARLKTINGNIENALSAVTSLSAVKFTWKSDAENKPQVGLLAQEVQQVLPEAVGEDVEGFLGVRYTEIVPLLVAAIKEQQAIITDMAAKLKAAGVTGF